MKLKRFSGRRGETCVGLSGRVMGYVTRRRIDAAIGKVNVTRFDCRKED